MLLSNRMQKLLNQETLRCPPHRPWSPCHHEAAEQVPWDEASQISYRLLDPGKVLVRLVPRSSSKPLRLCGQQSGRPCPRSWCCRGRTQKHLGRSSQ